MHELSASGYLAAQASRSARLVQTHPRLRDYPADTAMALHDHREATLSIVVRGGFRERVGRSERGYGCGHAAFFPAGVAHAQAFGSQGARQIIFEPRAA